MSFWICLNRTAGTCCEAAPGGFILAGQFKHVAERCVGSCLPTSPSQELVVGRQRAPKSHQTVTWDVGVRVDRPFARLGNLCLIFVDF